ncbi:MAG: hypothetical protein KGP35_05020 [Bacteroidetes bacterium]|nr:hypothetical protein [Bacteroidota bacterium]
MWIKQHSIFITCITLLILFFGISFPYYQYILDPDGAAYSAIAEQYAAGHFKSAVNGLWSPLHSWLIIPFIKAGIDAPIAFKLTNLILGIGLLTLMYHYLQKNKIERGLLIGILFSSLVIISYYIWYELAADFLFTCLLLIYFSITFQKNFWLNPKSIILASIVGAFAYLAKAIGFPFFLAHFSVLYFIEQKAQKKIQFFALGLLVFFVLSLPWMLTLEDKYQYRTFSPSGKLNMSWLLHPDVSPDRNFYPPPHEQAYSHWEDPWFVQDHFHSPFDSVKNLSILFRQILYNIQTFPQTLMRISFFAPAICLFAFYNLITSFRQKTAHVFLSIFLLPAGYAFFHWEERFLWPITFVLLIAGVYYLNNFLKTQFIKQWKKTLLSLIFFASFCWEPVNMLKDYRYFNKDLHEIAANLKKQSINGSFTSNKENNKCGVIAYLNRIKYYWPNTRELSPNHQMEVAKEMNIRYYLFFYSNQWEKNCFLQSISAHADFQISEIYPGIVAVRLSE